MNHTKSRHSSRLYWLRTHPEHDVIIQSVQQKQDQHKRYHSVYVAGLIELEEEETAHLIRAELEKIIWGETRTETTSAIEKIAGEIDELIRKAEEAEARRKEEARRANQEFLNRNRALTGLSPLPDDYGQNS